MENCNVDKNRRRFLTSAATVVGGAGAVAATMPFIATMAPSAKTKAIGGPIEVDVSKLQPGGLVIEKWQGKPIWILRRTKEMLEDVVSLDVVVDDPSSEKSSQPSYAKNEYRSIKDEFLVVIGICTHLGCSPKYLLKGSDNSPSEGWKGGFFCPCHGSSFDLAGRVYKNVPAPTNLVVPPYKFISPSILLIGDDGGAV